MNNNFVGTIGNLFIGALSLLVHTKLIYSDEIELKCVIYTNFAKNMYHYYLLHYF